MVAAGLPETAVPAATRLPRKAALDLGPSCYPPAQQRERRGESESEQ